MNNDAVEYLKKFDVEDTNYIVGLLIDGGFVEDGPEPVTRPERIAQAAKAWVGSGSDNTFHFASGWTTASWQQVLKDQMDSKISLDHNIDMIKDIFAALVILAKEAGVVL